MTSLGPQSRTEEWRNYDNVPPRHDKRARRRGGPQAMVKGSLCRQLVLPEPAASRRFIGRKPGNRTGVWSQVHDGRRSARYLGHPAAGDRPGRGARRALGRARRHDGRRQVVDRPPASALRLGIPFVDADTEIEKAAGMNIPDIFATHGEARLPRRRGARHRAPAGERAAGAGDRRRRLHECGHPRR